MTVAGTTNVVHFNRRCSMVGLIFLLATVGIRTYHGAAELPNQSVDYPQYYMAALIARAGAWDALYPVPIPGVTENPGSDRASTLRPGYARLATEAGVDLRANRFMQPPPVALFLTPLSLFSQRGAYFLWTGLLLAATWDLSRQASRLYTMCRGGVDERMAGLVSLLICVSPQAHRWIRVGNMSALIGWLLGTSLLSLLRREPIRGGVGIALAAIAKYVSLAWMPLLVVLQQWRALLWTIGVLVVINIITLFVAGLSPYRIFMRDIVPTLDRCTLLMANDSLLAFFMRMAGVTDETRLPAAWWVLFIALRGGSLAMIFGLLVIRRGDIRRNDSTAAASAVLLLGWTLVFSPILWEHYQAYLAVFWGWLMAEAWRSAMHLTVAVGVLLLIFAPTRTPALDGIIPEPIASHVLWGTLLFAALAMAAVWRPHDREEEADPLSRAGGG